MHYFIVVMHVTFQNYFSKLRWKVRLQCFNGVSAIDMETILQFHRKKFIAALSQIYLSGNCSCLCVNRYACETQQSHRQASM